MIRKISCFLVFCLLLAGVCALSSGAYTRISYGADCLADRAELIKSGLRGRDVVFTEADFRQALGVSRVDAITVLSLPAARDGVLKLGSVPVVSGQIISRSELGRLTFVAAGETTDTASFTFCTNSAAGTTALTCTLHLLDRINYAPTVKGLDGGELFVRTQKGIDVFGRMRAEDPENDRLTYLVLAYPQKGSLTVTDEATGAFRYTPAAGQTGTDSFRYVARDAFGNYSSIATVEIQILERSSSLVYADMIRDPAHNAALALAERNILLGSLEGDSMYFRPDGEVTRGEFLVMAMKTTGITPAAGVDRTWFDDDGSIPTAIRPYVATAQLYGYVNGYFDGTGLYFEADRAITRAEAAVILNNILGADTPDVLPTVADARDIPAWATDAVYALYAEGIFQPTDAGIMDVRAKLDRAAAAEILYALIEK